MRTLGFAALALGGAFFAAVPTAGVGAATCTKNLAGTIRGARSADQLVTVEAARYGTTYAALRLWQRDADGCWEPAAGPWTARVGRNGIADRRREGDGTTPTGLYTIGPVMYGVAANPGVRYRYRRVVCGDWWVEDPRSPAYNTFQHVRCGAPTPFRTKPPALWQDRVAYRHFAVVEYNMRPIVPGRGSGIFLHVAKNGPTVGCISLPRRELTTTLRWLRPASRPLIAIGTRSTFRRL